MSDTNYIGGIVKILEIPKQKFLDDNILVVTCRAQLSQVRQTQIVNLVFWGNLAYDVTNYYQVNDYILIEGYLSLRSSSKLELNIQTFKRLEITILKVYPFLLSYNHSRSSS